MELIVKPAPAIGSNYFKDGFIRQMVVGAYNYNLWEETNLLRNVFRMFIMLMSILLLVQMCFPASPWSP